MDTRRFIFFCLPLTRPLFLCVSFFFTPLIRMPRLCVCVCVCYPRDFAFADWPLCKRACYRSSSSPTVYSVLFKETRRLFGARTPRTGSIFCYQLLFHFVFTHGLIERYGFLGEFGILFHPLTPFVSECSGLIDFGTLVFVLSEVSVIVIGIFINASQGF